jgi:membrane protease subunit HflC
MEKSKGFIYFIVILAVIALVQGSFFIVDQTQSALILQLGKPVRDVMKPGLNFKLPFVQNVIFFDKRVLEYDSAPAEILTEDKKNLVVDNYAKWKIIEPLKFYQTVKNYYGAQSRLDDIIYSELRVVLGKHTLQEIVSLKRSEIMSLITKKCNEISHKYGIEILDVRIKRADLPPENERHVYDRMKAERKRQAKKYRSEGMEESLKIKSSTDKEKTIILSEANKKAEIIKGEGEAKAIEIYGKAFSEDKEFYEFYRTLNAYKESMSNNTKIILTPKNKFLKYLK